MQEIYRVRDWLADNELTAIITAKLEGHTSEVAPYGFMQFMVGRNGVTLAMTSLIQGASAAPGSGTSGRKKARREARNAP